MNLERKWAIKIGSGAGTGAYIQFPAPWILTGTILAPFNSSWGQNLYHLRFLMTKFSTENEGRGLLTSLRGRGSTVMEPGTSVGAALDTRWFGRSCVNITSFHSLQLTAAGDQLKSRSAFNHFTISLSGTGHHFVECKDCDNRSFEKKDCNNPFVYGWIRWSKT